MQPSKNVYRHPLQEPARQLTGSPAHSGNLEHAVDWECPEGTEIYAAQAGVVVYVKDDSREGGELDRKFWNSGNRIVIEHENGEFSAYEHLRYQGAVAKEGKQIEAGQLIGYSGNTGYSDCPHLHFEVFINPTEDKSEGETIPIRFTE